MSTKKKVLLAVGIPVGVVFAALLIVPLLFKDEINSRAHSALDEALDAQVVWSGIGLSFIRSFPNLTLSLRDLDVVGSGAFEGDTLATMGSFRLVLDLGSVIGSLRGTGPLELRSIRLDEPVVHLRVLEDGTANWDIVRSAAEAADAEEGGAAGAAAAGDTSGGMGVALRNFTISDGQLVVENEVSGLFASFEGIDHTLSGDFSQSSLVAKSDLRAERATLRFAGTPYLAGVALGFEAEVDADLAGKRFAFRDNELRLNDLALRFSGEADASGDDLALDLAFEAPRTEFRQILSLVPALYAQDFRDLEAEGSFAVEGEVRGTMREGALPSFRIAAQVDDGSFRYPDLPLGTRGIGLDLTVENPGGPADATVVRLERFGMTIGERSLDASLTLRTPVSDPDVDARAEGSLDLADLARTVHLEAIEELTGVLTADFAIRARLSDIEARRYERVAASGTLSARDVAVRGDALQRPVVVEEATLELSPRAANLRSFRAQLGSSDLQASARLDNVLGYLLRDDVLVGSGSFTSEHFVLDEWRSDDPSREVIPVPAGLDFTLDGTVERLDMGALQMADARGTLRVADQRVTLENLDFTTLGGRIGMTGFYETSDPERPTFNFAMTMDSLDIGLASSASPTLRAVAPVARYAQGLFSARMELDGALGSDMTPLLNALAGAGSFETSSIRVEGFPAFEKLSETLSLPLLSSPTMTAIRSAVEIRDGRVHLSPFQVGVGGVEMTVSGSNGLDQTLDYNLGLSLPSTGIGDAAGQALQGLADRAGGLGLPTSGLVRLGVNVQGSVEDPTLNVGLAGGAPSAGEGARQAVDQAVEQAVGGAVEGVTERPAEEARARADSIIASAEATAERIRAEARTVADGIRAEGDRRAEEVLAQATNPLARRAAQPVADRIRREADERADQVEREADERAEALLAEARAKAAEVRGGGGAEEDDLP
ncbi:MAG: AsmA-like C-terminal region-containing protein [Longimicrobiales bacterium]|nr:AsmA-like C-terminal region-containing protein [Longimicrobiales bacterium]